MSADDSGCGGAPAGDDARAAGAVALTAAGGRDPTNRRTTYAANAWPIFRWTMYTDPAPRNPTSPVPITYHALNRASVQPLVSAKNCTRATIMNIARPPAPIRLCGFRVSRE